MSVRNSSMSISHHKFYTKYKEIIDVFVYANSIGISEITIAYLLKNTLISQLELYRKVHELLEMNILDVNSYEECMYCTNYNNDRIIEKFRLIKDIENEY